MNLFKRFKKQTILLAEDDEPPLRAELFSAAQMEQYGRVLAARHLSALRPTTQHTPDQLLPRLADNEHAISTACAALIDDIKNNRLIMPAAEWLLDNFYLIEEQICTAKQHLPKGYSKELPRLTKGVSVGKPRVYDIALETISHGDGRVDVESLRQFVSAYQQVTTLTLGELWAIPIMLRLALIENLRRVSTRIAINRANRKVADDWADQMIEAAESDPSGLILLVADMARSVSLLDSSFVAELARRLQGHGPTLTLPLTWVAQRLAETGLSIENLVLAETQQQAAGQVTISNSICSLRFLRMTDWREFVEEMSHVEQVLKKDAADIYNKMDFSTRDRYRHVIEKLAKKCLLEHTNNETQVSKVSDNQVLKSQLSSLESKVANEALLLSQAAAVVEGKDSRTAHIGYYLMGKGLPALEKSLNIRYYLLEKIVRKAKRMPLVCYLGAIAGLTFILTALTVRIAFDNGLVNVQLISIGLLLAFVNTQLAIALVNWLTTLLTAPHTLPRLNFSKGIPSSARTLVVVPTLLINTQGIERLCESLEVSYLANRDEHLHFCLLTDFMDANAETTPSDEALIQQACQAIAALNDKYATVNSAYQASPFLLLNRPRRWNAQDKCWMGYERKRGKLADLNALLRSDPNSNFSALFSTMVGDIDALSSIKYVITLDTDTQLPRDSARQFVATIAHPLNKAGFEHHKCVTEGYGILQPRVVASLPSANASFYEKLCVGEAGIDPYTRSVSDIYQDLFEEGSFIGKGIYEVDAFEQALQGEFPENRILSHDLLEGCYARSGLMSDSQLYEAYPSLYSADVSRRHRWIRGDWQLLAWLFPMVPVGLRQSQLRSTSVSRLQPNPLSILSRFKILDNLRRSLISPALLGLLLAGWMVLPLAWLWTNAVLAVLFVPAVIVSLVDLVSKPKLVLWRQHVTASLRAAKQHLTHAALNLIFLPYEAIYSLDAIFRTLLRMLVTHKLMLQWNPSSEFSHKAKGTLTVTLRDMWSAPAIAIAVIIALTIMRSVVLYLALPYLLLWIASPAIAWWISRPIPSKQSVLQAEQVIFLHRLAHKTWHFFQTYVSADDNWLPPDNMQQHPVMIVAHRTSPTNIGLALLANLAAYDFAYTSAGQLLRRTDNTMRTMANLERHQGHFYNWYDTQTLQPLLPMYVSTVDSGNLAGHLLTLRAGLQALPMTPIVPIGLFDLLNQTIKVLLNMMQIEPAPMFKTQSSLFTEVALAQLAQIKLQLEIACAKPPVLLTIVAETLKNLTESAQVLCAELTLNVGPESEALCCIELFESQCRDAYDDLLYLAPWLHSSGLDLLKAHSHGLSVIVAHHDLLNKIVNLHELARLSGELQQSINTRLISNALMPAILEPSEVALNEGLIQLLAEGSRRAAERIALTHRLILQATEFAHMEYTFLYDETTHLLAIGYNVTECRRDAGYYDLLASEARLCSFVAIAQGQLPQESWFALGRQLTVAGGKPILLSWSGSMFEYLMPLLVMPNFENTLLDQTYQSVVQRQIDYGIERGVPWGVSESGYYAFDSSLNYQYRAFGIPGLGLKRGLGDDLVIAPYASMLALMVAPAEACANLQRMVKAGFEGMFGLHLEGKFGLHEAIDYTPIRIPRGQSEALVRSYMAHHQGMSLLSLAYVLLNRPMQRRFESDPLFQATLLLLKERIPKPTAFYSNTTELADIRVSNGEQEMPIRVITQANTRYPEVQLLSNGRYHVMVTNAGGSYSRWRDLSLTRWREDSTCDQWGSFCYVRDLADSSVWSTAHQPTLKMVSNYEVIFSEARAEFRLHHNGFDMHTEIVVSPEDDIELRRTRITNRSRVTRTIDVTSYAEVVLAPAAADAAHTAFSNLFVQTEILPEQHAILCRRRPRSDAEQVPVMFHLMSVHGINTSHNATEHVQVENTSYETDRATFIGRGHTVSAPQAMTRRGLSNTEGSVLDPIVAIRRQITLAPEQAVIVDMVTGISDTHEGAISLIDKYQDLHLADRVFELAWTHSQVILRQLNASEADAQLYGRLANSIVYANPSLRADASTLIKNHRGQSALWSYAISGDLPIVLCQIGNIEQIELIRQMVQAHVYWRLKGLAVDLVIWNEDRAVYRQVLQEQIVGLVASTIEPHNAERPGGIFVRHADQVSDEDRILLQTVARVIVADSGGTLAEQIGRRNLNKVRMPNLVPSTEYAASLVVNTPPDQADLLVGNGLGGFSPDGREYVITTASNNRTPAPWVNVIANAQFGTVISESGQAYTWGENAHEFRLTPWSNDAVSDGGGEMFYLRDEDNGHFWSPTALPSTGKGDYTTHHGFGYSTFKHIENGIESSLTIYVAQDASVKFSVLKVRNATGSVRRLSATGYVEWVLGDLRQKTAMHVVTESDPATGALFAKNPYNTEFTERVAFFYVDAMNLSMTGDRDEFIGRNSNLQNPAAMSRIRLSGKLGAGLDPCGAIQVPFILEDGEEKEIIFLLGVADKRNTDISALIRRFRGTQAAREALNAVNHYWQHTLGAIQVNTPDQSLNILANGWLIYQTIACRLWARSGFYQSGGAFGFRDQLQDVMALIYAEPHLVREHLLRAAGHQFIEGDAQHWWHPPINRGVRTHCSDDFLWLPLATCRYVTSTHDNGVLDETIGFLEGRLVNMAEDSYYDLPNRSLQSGTLYEHCKRAIMHGLRFGVHGLPLIGSCDWNDGMDKVGNEGKGESVWLGFFLYEVLTRFIEVAHLYDDKPFVALCQQEALTLKANIEKNGWDGDWYRRAYFDDGTPLGSVNNDECKIDSISQSWSILSGIGLSGLGSIGIDNTARSERAMQALNQHLVRREAALVQLLDPPFDHSSHNPGYIRGYVPGVRENGGQYTHAAIWASMAFAKMGDTSHAWDLFNMINPVNHGSTPEEIAVYKVEPYVIAADVYAVAPHVGRGGWTWYTGSSGWMYRLIVESLLGLTLAGDKLSFTPCFPADWQQFTLNYQFRATQYQIKVMKRQEAMLVNEVIIDDIKQEAPFIHLIDDEQVHRVTVFYA